MLLLYQQTVFGGENSNSYEHPLDPGMKALYTTTWDSHGHYSVNILNQCALNSAYNLCNFKFEVPGYISGSAGVPNFGWGITEYSSQDIDGDGIANPVLYCWAAFPAVQIPSGDAVEFAFRSIYPALSLQAVELTTAGAGNGLGLYYGPAPVLEPDNDYDNDGLTILEEYENKTNENNPDTDSDIMPDGWEVDNILNPLLNDADNDADNDGLTNLIEYLNATNPQDNDSDNDGLFDAYEVNNNLNPNQDDSQNDTDNDGLTNLQEQTYQTNPNSADSDNDTMPDGDEVFAGTDPTDSESYLFVSQLNMFSKYQQIDIPVICWTSEPSKTYTIWVKADSIGENFVVLDNNVISRGTETIYPDQGGGPNAVPHPRVNENPRIYKVSVNPE